MQIFIVISNFEEEIMLLVYSSKYVYNHVCSLPQDVEAFDKTQNEMWCNEAGSYTVLNQVLITINQIKN